MDPDFAEFLVAFPPPQFIDPAAQRKIAAEARRELSPVPWPEGVSHEDQKVPGVGGHEIPVRCYVPDDVGDEAPVVLWIHGGGYCVGDPEDDEPFCARLAVGADAVVMSVEYRLAPEDPYPAGLDDCYAVLLDIAASYPMGPVVVAGQSAGGGLAAAVALRARDEGWPAVHGQVLLCPFLDSTMSGPSMSTLADAPVFNSTDAFHCWEHYLGTARTDPPPYGSPPAADDVSKLPPAYVLAAGVDCLRDEAIEYALRLQAAGVPTELHVVPEVPHAFTALQPGAVISKRLRDELIDVFRRMTGQS
ncbi:alpha/beta hydrolase [Saccharopolyspora sp. NPDC000995]